MKGAPITAAVPFRAPQAPSLDDLSEVARQALLLFQRVPRDQWVNGEGGDVGCSGSERSLLRHAANYLAAAEFAEARGGVTGPVIDVGGGVGAFGVWLADRLAVPLWLVDPDPDVRSAAANAFPQARLFESIEDVPERAGGVVTAMEVIEHMPHSHQTSFAAHLGRVAAPGGLVVVSTPDERGFVGGWSGYAPHVGVLDAPGLERVLRNGLGAPAHVWRLEGQPFRLGRVEAVWQPVVNRLWRTSAALAPPVVRWVSRQAAALRASARGWTTRDSFTLEGRAWAVAPDQGDGTGLLAVVPLPG